MADVVHKFLDKEVPYTGTSAWRDWQEECNRLGPDAPPVFLEALRTGPEHTPYCAESRCSVKMIHNAASTVDSVVPFHKLPDEPWRSAT
jgi:hypothetical protein